jgi:carbon starvation protein
MFGTANQLLATIALAVGTSYIINRGKVRYAWVTFVPMLFVGTTTISAGVMNMINIFIPQLSVPEKMVPGIINLALTVLIITCVIVVIVNAAPKWIKAVKSERTLK